jgi:hypothetical protein
MAYREGIARRNIQPFAVVGADHVPVRHSESRHDLDQLPSAQRAVIGANVWLAFYLLAALTVAIANVASFVHTATATREAKPVPIDRPAGLAPSIAIFGGGEPILW